MADRVYEVEILNWDKYQGRVRDVKSPVWFSVRHDTFFSPAILTLPPEGKLFWFYLLCEASRSTNRGFATVSAPSASRASGICEKDVDRWLLHLQQFQMVRTRLRQARDRSGTYVARIRQDTTLQDTTSSPAVSGADPTGSEAQKQTDLDFEILYQNYPRKRGKSRGIAACRRQIKSLKNYEDLDKAIKNYALETRGREQDKIMHFSTFMGEWTDWIDVDITAKRTGTVLVDF